MGSKTRKAELSEHQEVLKNLSEEFTSWNYKYFGKYGDVSMLQGLLGHLNEEDWENYNWRQKSFGVHATTQTIPIIYDMEYGTQRGKESKFYNLFEKELKNLSLVFQKEEIIRAVLVKLPSGGEVKQHWDLGSESFRNHPRIHMAVQTNQHVNFNVGGEDKHMKLGEFWEINNFAKQHGVHNHGDTDRIHLILDLKKAPISLF